MRLSILTLFLVCFNMACQHDNPRQQPAREPFPITLVIHGGAGTIMKQNMTPEREQEYHMALQHALDTGYAILRQGGKSVEAVIAAVTVLENSPLFNAGKGAVFTFSGKNELDASIMDGSSLAAGAVAGVTTIKIPSKPLML